MATEALEKFSDFTIKYAHEEKKVHRVILAKSSQYFARCFENGFKETIDRSIELKDDDPEIVRLMIEFFYTSDYILDEPSEQKSELLAKHAAVYGIAEKYEAPNLKTLAAKRFGESVPSAISTQENILTVIELVYTTTPESDRALRDIVSDLWLLMGSHVIIQHGDSVVNSVLKGLPEFTLAMAKKFALLAGESNVKAMCYCNGRASHGRGNDIFERCCFTCARPVKDSKEMLLQPSIQINRFW